jgi:hypothetical protein
MCELSLKPAACAASLREAPELIDSAACCMRNHRMYGRNGMPTFVGEQMLKATCRQADRLRDVGDADLARDAAG